MACLQDMACALLVLEAAVRPDRFKPWWRLWCTPLPHPSLTGTPVWPLTIILCDDSMHGLLELWWYFQIQWCFYSLLVAELVPPLS